MSNKVFYANRDVTRDTGFFGMARSGELEDNFYDRIQAAVRNPANYTHVASFDDSARDLEDIWTAMQSEVSGIPRKLRNRSMMVGDIILTGDGSIWVVASCGFTKVEDIDAPAFLARASATVPSFPVPSKEESHAM